MPGLATVAQAGLCGPTTQDVGTGGSVFYSAWTTPGDTVLQTHLHNKNQKHHV